MMNKKFPYGFGLAFPTSLVLTLRRINLRRWTMGLWLAGLLIGFIYSLFRQPITLSPPSDVLDYALSFIVFFLFGCPGGLFVLRGEALGRAGQIFRGKGAVVYGLILLLSCWGLAFYSIYRAAQIILGK